MVLLEGEGALKTVHQNRGDRDEMSNLHHVGGEEFPDHRLIVTIEDNGRQGGVGSTVVQAVSDAGLAVPVRVHAIAQEFLPHAKRDVLLERLGLTAPAVADDALRTLSGAGNNEG